jgi:LAS superfamily LD-carboxypeptidase LdcB
VQEDPGATGLGGAGSSVLVPIDIDVATADESTLGGTAEEIRANVASHLAALETAETALATAETALAAKRSAIEATQSEIDVLESLSDHLVIGAYMHPPADSAVDLLQTGSPGDVATKQVLLELRADEDGDALAALADARDRLADLVDAEADSLAAAEDARDEAAATLENLQAAASQQVRFAREVEVRLERGLTEVQTLSEIDPGLASTVEGDQGELLDVLGVLDTDSVLEHAGVLSGDGRVGGNGTSATPAGGISRVTCSSGGGFDVAGDIAGGVQSLLDLAADQGLGMCGTGWRDPAEQVALRRQNCGSSDYAIYEAPSSSCSPPTARPGASLHEQGLAVDFTCDGPAVRRSDPCYLFLATNAATHGLYNLPSESWHWSTDGT